jgi:recombination protein RecA
MSSGSKADQQDALSAEILKTLNKDSKGAEKSAYFLTDPKSVSEVRGWVPTGAAMLDLAISNRPYGGYPVGRITEITGIASSGKSLLGAHALATTQRAGGISILIDTEFAVDETFFRAIGVDTSGLIVKPAKCLEDAFGAIEALLAVVKKHDANRNVTIVLDTVMACPLRKELESQEMGGMGTERAKYLSYVMRRITGLVASQNVTLIIVNQLRERIGVMFGDKHTTSGGAAIGFHASVRLRTSKPNNSVLAVERIKDVKEQIGERIEVKVIKNKVGPPKRRVVLDMYYASGIDDYGSWLALMKQYNLLKSAGSYYKYTYVVEETGEEKTIQFQSKDLARMLREDEGLRKHMYRNICDAYIMNYRVNEDFGSDDVSTEIDEDD